MFLLELWSYFYIMYSQFIISVTFTEWTAKESQGPADGTAIKTVTEIVHYFEVECVHHNGLWKQNQWNVVRASGHYDLSHIKDLEREWEEWSV